MSEKNNCTICAFENPHPYVKAICIKNGALLVARRNEELYKGEWDFIGGYMQKDETPEQALRREIKEELGVECALTYINVFTGGASYQEYYYPVLGYAFLAELYGDIVLSDEITEPAWIPLSELQTVAFDSNQKMLAWVKEKFSFDLVAVKHLVYQMDTTAVVEEQSLYKAVLNGYVSTVKDGKKLVGMGWIFPRQTLLRNQAVIEDMVVDESYRGKGYGEKILKDLIDWARRNKIEVIELTTHPGRVAANSLYKKCGFVLHETNHYLLDMRGEEK